MALRAFTFGDLWRLFQKSKKRKKIDKNLINCKASCVECQAIRAYSYTDIVSGTKDSVKPYFRCLLYTKLFR